MEHDLNTAKIVILGQDERQIAMAEELNRVKIGFSVVSGITSKEQALAAQSADYIVLPVSGTVENVSFDESWIKSLHKKTVILAGKTPDSFRQYCQNYQIRQIEYLKRKDFQIANAVPTAEGAIKLYMDMAKQTINTARMLVLGFGQCGSALSLRLKAMGASVTVFARKKEELILGRSLGLDIREYSQLPKLVRQKHCLFNTVPAKLLDSSILPFIPTDCIIIDIASAPGGTDFELCRKLGINSILASNLPGRFFPKTAGKILADTIVNILEEESSASKNPGGSKNGIKK